MHHVGVTCSISLRALAAPRDIHHHGSWPGRFIGLTAALQRFRIAHKRRAFAFTVRLALDWPSYISVSGIQQPGKSWTGLDGERFASRLLVCLRYGSFLFGHIPLQPSLDSGISLNESSNFCKSHTIHKEPTCPPLQLIRSFPSFRASHGTMLHIVDTTPCCRYHLSECSGRCVR